MKSHIIAALAVSLIAFGCDSGSSGVPQSSAAKKMGDAPKQTVDKVVNEANKAIEQGEARTREAIDGNK
jgi:hypothetical protein